MIKEKTKSTLISIVIPVYNEENYISHLLGSLVRLPQKLELIVVDGGSNDKTHEIVEKYNCKIILSKKGRASQMNKGADLAKGEYLLFLHADTAIGYGFEKELDSLINNEISLASFRLKFEPSSFFLRFNTFFTRFNHPWFYFGDQGLWLKRDLFKAYGGFDERYRVLEDQEFYARLSSNTIAYKSKYTIKSSSRAYAKYGDIKLQFLYYKIWFLYKLGSSPNKLAQMKESLSLKYKY